jgi:hypothetical protein
VVVVLLLPPVVIDPEPVKLKTKPVEADPSEVPDSDENDPVEPL